MFFMWYQSICYLQVWDNIPDILENDMMKSRWRVFIFLSIIAQDKQKNTHPCGKYFSQLILMGYIQ